MIHIVIPIVPTGQMRARATVRGRHAMVYKADKQERREETLKAFLVKYRPDTPLEGPLMLGVKVYLPVAKSKPAKFRRAALAGEIRPQVKPDLDNAIKNIKDVLTEMGFWEDDRQVVEYLPGTGKWYSDHPRWEVEIRAWRP